MDKQDIIRMAREANDYAHKHGPAFWLHPDEWQAFRDERFAALVAAHEREACAQLCENLEMHPDQGDCWDIGTIDCADAIRAKGEQK